jgi:fatty-acyl-CoA synthase
MNRLPAPPPEGPTLWDAWCRNAATWPEKEAVVHWVAGETPRRWYWGELLEAASRQAAQLRARGVRAGEVCALIVRHHPDFYPAYLGVCALGALPAVLAYPNPRLHPDKFRQGLEGMARHSGLDWILTESELVPIVRPLLDRAHGGLRGLLTPLEGGTEDGSISPVAAHADIRPEDPCLLQHSSGTTGLQKAVVLSHRAVLEHVQRYGAAIALGPDDRIVSWLPLYHDMGLIAAFYLALTSGVTLVQLDPFEWVKAPVILLEAIAREGGTLSWLPNFAYELLAGRVHDEDLAGIRLDSLRLLVNCSEPVRSESHRRFRARYAPFGLRPEALGACYAMAETTFAATQTAPGAAARELSVDRQDLARGAVRLVDPRGAARICVSSGHPISGCVLRVVDDAGADLEDDRVGEIVIRSASLFEGYRNRPEATAEALRSGWFYSGDYGFRHDGDYFVIGRKKDLIIVAGRNIYPEDIEDAVSQVRGVLPGRVVAFGVDNEELGTEEVGVITETSIENERELYTLRRAVVEAGMQIDVSISRVFLVPPRWLIKSSSGKPSRRENKERALRNEAEASGTP